VFRKTAEIRGTGTPAGIAEGTVRITDSEEKGEKKLTWTARRGGMRQTGF
jgi:hypothetical protein